jgi:hypothetical protein
MPKYEIELTFYRTVEAPSAEDAADMADYEKSRLVDNGLAGDLGWREAVTTVKRKKES